MGDRIKKWGLIVLPQPGRHKDKAIEVGAGGSGAGPSQGHSHSKPLLPLGVGLHMDMASTPTQPLRHTGEDTGLGARTLGLCLLTCGPAPTHSMCNCYPSWCCRSLPPALIFSQEVLCCLLTRYIIYFCITLLLMACFPARM